METETSFVSPLLSKDAVKYITQNIDDEEVQYVQDVKSVYDNAKLSGCDEKECEDILYITKIIAFHDKFRVLHWAAKSLSYHNELDKFCDVIGGYKDAIAENIQSIIGKFNGNEFQSIVLPISNDPLDVIDFTLKMLLMRVAATLPLVFTSPSVSTSIFSVSATGPNQDTPSIKN